MRNPGFDRDRRGVSGPGMPGAPSTAPHLSAPIASPYGGDGSHRSPPPPPGPRMMEELDKISSPYGGRGGGAPPPPSRPMPPVGVPPLVMDRPGRGPSPPRRDEGSAMGRSEPFVHPSRLEAVANANREAESRRSHKNWEPGYGGRGPPSPRRDSHRPPPPATGSNREWVGATHHGREGGWGVPPPGSRGEPWGPPPTACGGPPGPPLGSRGEPWGLPRPPPSRVDSWREGEHVNGVPPRRSYSPAGDGRSSGLPMGSFHDGPPTALREGGFGMPHGAPRPPAGLPAVGPPPSGPPGAGSVHGPMATPAPPPAGGMGGGPPVVLGGVVSRPPPTSSPPGSIAPGLGVPPGGPQGPMPPGKPPIGGGGSAGAPPPGPHVIPSPGGPPPDTGGAGLPHPPSQGMGMGMPPVIPTPVGMIPHGIPLPGGLPPGGVMLPPAHPMPGLPHTMVPPMPMGPPGNAMMHGMGPPAMEGQAGMMAGQPQPPFGMWMMPDPGGMFSGGPAGGLPAQVSMPAGGFQPQPNNMQPVGGSHQMPLLGSQAGEALGQSMVFDQQQQPQPQKEFQLNPNVRLSDYLSCIPSAVFDQTPGGKEMQYQWSYVDLQGKTQGPFDTISMLRWWEGGHFPTSTQVKTHADPQFQPLGDGTLLWSRARSVIMFAAAMKGSEMFKPLEMQTVMNPNAVTLDAWGNPATQQQLAQQQQMLASNKGDSDQLTSGSVQQQQAGHQPTLAEQAMAYRSAMGQQHPTTSRTPLLPEYGTQSQQSQQMNMVNQGTAQMPPAPANTGGGWLQSAVTSAGQQQGNTAHLGFHYGHQPPMVPNSGKYTDPYAPDRLRDGQIMGGAAHRAAPFGGGVAPGGGMPAAGQFAGGAAGTGGGPPLTGMI